MSGYSTDEQLLSAHVAGDRSAFGELFSRHRDRLWAIAIRTMKHPEDAADALQDALISAFRRASTFHGKSAVTTWLHRIVVNACLDRIRANRVRRAESLETVSGAVSFSVPDPTDAADLGVVIAEALAELNADQRVALVLVDMQGYSINEAAAMLGCPAGTIKSRCFRGRERMAALLSPLQEEGNQSDA